MSSVRILIIDDDELDRLSIVRALKKYNEDTIYIAQASTAQEGLAIATSESFDAILLDYRLPDQDGLEVLKMLHVSGDALSAVVMLSRVEDERLAEKALDAGAQEFLLKEEVNPQRLYRVIRQARHRRQLEAELQQTHLELKRLAEHDSLTGLANRYNFEYALRAELQRTQASRKQGTLAIFLLDIDNFKYINDSYGHSCGDQLLIEVAARLNAIVRESDLLARLGGDEFVILNRSLECEEQAALLANRIIETFKAPIMLGDVSCVICVSIGVSVYGDTANNDVDLMRCADIAMYRAKQEGQNQAHFYSDELHQVIRLRSVVGQDLRFALERDQFELYYQPQIDVQTGNLGGLEALIRWNHPRLGLLSPGKFLDIAEEVGLMNDIGAWVLRTACKQLACWQSSGVIDDLSVAVGVNVSAIQLRSHNFVDVVKDALASTGLKAINLELEITESTVIRDPIRAAETLSNISALGVKLSLDDFGTGYSSFEHLQIFPIQTMKIDKAFVAGISRQNPHKVLLAAMIGFARKLGLRVVAEGIETAEQQTFCATNGCHLLQGYFFSKPVSACDFASNFAMSSLSKNA